VIIKIPPPILTIVFGTFMYGVDQYLDIRIFSQSISWILVVALSFASICFLIPAVLGFRKHEILIHTIHKPEELALVKLFGDEFEEYKARVRRWV